MIQVDVPLKAMSVNAAYRGRRFQSALYKQYEKDLGLLLPPKEALEGPVRIEYSFYLRNDKRTDLDNLIKPLQDILVKRGYIKDDTQVYELEARKLAAKEDSISVKITGLSPKKSLPWKGQGFRQDINS